MMRSISPIDTFFSENRLYILGFDSHDVHSKIMKNCENFEKKLKFSILVGYTDTVLGRRYTIGKQCFSTDLLWD